MRSSFNYCLLGRGGLRVAPFLCFRGDLRKDAPGCIAGAFGLGDGTAYDKHGGSACDGFARGGDTLLVADVGSCGTDAGNYEEGPGPKLLAEGSGLFRRADEALDPAGASQAGETEDLSGRCIRDACALELDDVHAGEDGHSKQARRGRIFGRSLGGGAEHRFASAGVKGEQASAYIGDRADGSGDGVGDVVELQVEEDLESAVTQGLDQRVASGAVKLEADLHPATTAFEPVDEVESLASSLEVEGYGELLFRLVAEIGAQGAFFFQRGRHGSSGVL